MPLNDFKILVLEPKPGARSQGCRYFGELGFETEGVERISQAWNKLEAQGYDLLIMDLDGACPDVLELMVRLRGLYSNMKVLMIADLEDRLARCFQSEGFFKNDPPFQTDSDIDRMVGSLLGLLPPEELTPVSDHSS